MLTTEKTCCCSKSLLSRLSLETKALHLWNAVLVWIAGAHEAKDYWYVAGVRQTIPCNAKALPSELPAGTAYLKADRNQILNSSAPVTRFYNE